MVFSQTILQKKNHKQKYVFSQLEQGYFFCGSVNQTYHSPLNLITTCYLKKHIQ